MQVGGGVNLDNAVSWLDAGASHVIVTSFVFKGGKVDYDNLKKLYELVGKDRLCLDLSCSRKVDEPDGPYYIVKSSNKEGLHILKYMRKRILILHKIIQLHVKNTTRV